MIINKIYSLLIPAYLIGLFVAGPINNCNATTVLLPFTVTAGITANERCNGQSIGSAIANPTGGTTPYTYYWSPSGQTTQTATGLSAGLYTVSVTDASGQTDTASVFIRQPSPILVSFTADSLFNCGQLCTTFTDMSWDYAGSAYIVTNWNWDFGDGGTSTLQNPGHCYSTPGKYDITLTVKDRNGCSAKLTIPDMINVYSYPHAAFTINPQITTLSNPGIQFTDKSTDEYGIGAWAWNFADTSEVSTLQNPYHIYKDTLTYCVKLKVTSIYGCSDSTTNCLTIYPTYTLWIPDAFSPNGDGINDVFMPKGKSIKTFSMYIFNRWGEEIFHSNNFNKGWNGGYNGSPVVCPADAYIYVINVTDNLDLTHHYMGKVILIQ